MSSVASPHAAYHYLAYSYVNGSIVLSAPESHRYVFGRQHNDSVLSVMFACPEPPRRVRHVQRLLRKIGDRFAPGRLVKLADERFVHLYDVDDASPVPASEIRYVAVEKYLCESGMIEKPIEEAPRLVLRPRCYLCSAELGFGSRCEQCRRETCVRCRPHEFAPNRWQLDDERFAVRVFVRPRCEHCLPIYSLL